MNHKDLNAWKESIQLVKLIYTISSLLPSSEMYGLTSQIRRSAISIPSNIAEGAARNSTKEFIQFLHISLGSLSEVETYIILIEEIKLLDGKPLDDIFEKVKFCRKLITGLIKQQKSKLKG